MNRSLYSLILADDVVREIDRLAYSERTNRSNLINQILADFVSVTTPEKQIKNIFDEIDRAIGGEENYEVFYDLHDSTIVIKSATDYKYRPAIKYSVELFKTASNNIGRLKVVFRTQSEKLLLELSDFFKIFAELENKYVCQLLYDTQNSIECEYGEGKFTRLFVTPKSRGYTENELAEGISEYVNNFDHMLKKYLSENYNEIGEIEKDYLDYIRTAVIL